jgi:hypothetical protein
MVKKKQILFLKSFRRELESKSIIILEWNVKIALSCFQPIIERSVGSMMINCFHLKYWIDNVIFKTFKVLFLVLILLPSNNGV